MRSEIAFVMEPLDYRLPRRILVPERKPSHRPRVRYRIRIRTARDAAWARHAGIPVYLLAPGILAALGYPMTFPPHLIVARECAEIIESAYPQIRFVSSDAAGHPRIEDLVVAMLRIDPLAARAVALRNREFVNPVRLLRRVVQEDVEREATLVRLQEVSPGIPDVGKPLPKAGLSRQDRNNEVVGML